MDGIGRVRSQPPSLLPLISKWAAHHSSHLEKCVKCCWDARRPIATTRTPAELLDELCHSSCGAAGTVRQLAPRRGSHPSTVVCPASRIAYFGGMASKSVAVACSAAGKAGNSPNVGAVCCAAARRARCKGGNDGCQPGYRAAAFHQYKSSRRVRCAALTPQIPVCSLLLSPDRKTNPKRQLIYERQCWYQKGPNGMPGWAHRFALVADVTAARAAA